MERTDALPVMDAMVPQDRTADKLQETSTALSQFPVSNAVESPDPVLKLQPQKMPILQLPVVQVASHQPILQGPVITPTSLQQYLQPAANVPHSPQYQFLPSGQVISTSQQVICSPRQGSSPILSTSGHILQVPGQSLLPGQLMNTQLPIMSIGNQFSVMKQE